jgi:hypothetical protein
MWASISKGSLSWDLVRAIVAVEFVLRVGVRPVDPLPQDGAELLALGEVLHPVQLGRLSHEEEVLLAMGESLQEVLLLRAHLLEEVGVSLVVLDHGDAVLELVDLVGGQVPGAHRLEPALPVLPQDLLSGHPGLGGHDRWGRICCTFLATFGPICTNLFLFVPFWTDLLEAHLGAGLLLLLPLVGHRGLWSGLGGLSSSGVQTVPLHDVVRDKVLEAYVLLAFSLVGIEDKSLPQRVLGHEARAHPHAEPVQLGDFKDLFVAGEVHPLEQVLEVPLLLGLEILVLPLLLLEACFGLGFLRWHFLIDKISINDSIRD